MSPKETKNVVASVLARLRNSSKSSGSPFQQVLQQYAIERLLYRISMSKHAKSVVRQRFARWSLIAIAIAFFVNACAADLKESPSGPLTDNPVLSVA